MYLQDLKCSVMDCVFEEVFLIKSNDLSFDEKLRNPRAFICNSISQTNLGCISYGTENNALVAWTLIKGFKDPMFMSCCSVYLSSNEIMTPQELNTLWEQFLNAVPREPSNVIWRNCVRGTGKQPKLLSLIESIFSQRILRKQKTFCLKWLFFVFFKPERRKQKSLWSIYKLNISEDYFFLYMIQNI